jgi:transglutaminase-like putative cysteine protease
LVRTVLLSLLPAVLIATGWRQLELPGEGREIALVALIGLLVAALPHRLVRATTSGVAVLVTVQLAFGLRPVGGVFSEFGNGVLDYYEVTLPFDPVERERMHGVLLVAVFAFVLGASIAIAQRRAILASALTFAGAAWPVTLIRDAPSTARGAFLLVAALILLAALRPGPRPAAQATLVGGGVLLAALVAVSSPAVAKGGFLDWEQWEPYTRPQNPVSVSYIWDADYDGITFPKRATTVLTIKAPPRAPYWRAATLNDFVDGHWRESLNPIEPVNIDGRDALIGDPLVPRAAWQGQNWLRQEVTVRALRDTHLVGATMPIAFEQGAGALYSPGVAHVSRLRRGEKYEVWSYVQRPTPGQLARSRPAYPSEIANASAFLITPSGFLPPFGVPNREALMRSLFARAGSDARYQRLYQTALRVAGRPHNPYAAVVALEVWFRTVGNFTYDEKPPVKRGIPPLVAFVTDHRRGYCQHFAGAMALMLRYLGIPARVGAGFTSGRYNDEKKEWTVSDKDAHTWVEAWFAGYGWLPFDPTPGRGRLTSSYTSSSIYFDASGAGGAFAGVSAAALEALRSRLPGDRLDGRDGRTAPRGSSSKDADRGTGLGGSLVALFLLFAAGISAAMWTLKTARRRSRYFTRDPRRLAGAVRLDLVDFLVDQRIPISPGATPAEIGTELERSLAVPGHRIADALAHARYGPEGQASGAAARARRELRTVRRSLRQRLGVRDRVRGLLSLRSLGLGAG